MNNFELFKLKAAGLKNQQILNIITYRKKHKTPLSVRNMAVVAQCQDPIIFMENYKGLELTSLRRSFLKYPSFSILDDCYPLALREIYQPPILLFYQGNLQLLEKPKLGVVGSRKASEEGIKATAKLVGEVANRLVIVSGLARGIDTQAHLASIRHKGQTIGVIGCGFDHYYPKENRRLQSYLASHHLVLTEYAPDEPPLAYHFPERNRIIAGLSRGVLVVEAKYRSGSLITCQQALDEGRDVFAVPGNILTGYSEGCHQLIKDGAKCVTTGLDILSEVF
ncbi:DNA-processing protein DprA [Streptococcus halichoeri]|uniref:DNA-processing protein DprA n=1 Tax=Streptococcus halichoeri TaxID=254785 RepID=UPI00135829BE|nr:DNA-processing protein DprA [Streptococcus halichoeri]